MMQASGGAVGHVLFQVPDTQHQSSATEESGDGAEAGQSLNQEDTCTPVQRLCVQQRGPCMGNRMLLQSVPRQASLPDWYSELIGQTGDVASKLLLVEEADEEYMGEVGDLQQGAHRRKRRMGTSYQSPALRFMTAAFLLPDQSVLKAESSASCTGPGSGSLELRFSCRTSPS